MRIALRSLVFSSAAFCATVAFAANQARVDVPFSFTAKGHSYPAGMYDIRIGWQPLFRNSGKQGRSDETDSVVCRAGRACFYACGC